MNLIFKNDELLINIVVKIKTATKDKIFILVLISLKYIIKTNKPKEALMVLDLSPVKIIQIR